MAEAISQGRSLWLDWGASKLRHLLIQQRPELSRLWRSTVHRILLRQGLVRTRRSASGEWMRTSQEVLRLGDKAKMTWAGPRWMVSRALQNEWVGVERTNGRAVVYYCNTPVLERNLKTGNTAALPVDPFRPARAQKINTSS
jgi:hypothetical protein